MINTFDSFLLIESGFLIFFSEKITIPLVAIPHIPNKNNKGINEDRILNSGVGIESSSDLTGSIIEEYAIADMIRILYCNKLQMAPTYAPFLYNFILFTTPIWYN